MSSRASWTHIRTSYGAQDVRKGLEARIADPLWSLSRQWQMGEFDGDDAASPIKIKVNHGHLKVNGLSSPRQPNTVYKPDADDLIEPMIEASAAENGPAVLRMSGEAGLQLLRLLPDDKRASTLKAMQRKFPLKVEQTGDPSSQKILDYLARGAFDGFALRNALVKNPRAVAQQISLPKRTSDQIGKQWLDYVDARFADQIGTGFWRQDRLEHRARLHAKQADGSEVTLSADEHAGGDLDWHAFDIPRGGTKGSLKKLQGQTTEWLLPTPIAYSGMPAERFWDFEDGEVFFGGLTLEKTDLAQVVLTEFATVYSNDWFMVPVPTQTGTLTRITHLEVYDTFGDKTVVKPCAVEDSGKRPWRFFELTGDTSAQNGDAPWLYIPRSAAGGDHSRPVEEVTFVRDEMANLAWGIERRVESAAGLPINRDQYWKRHSDAFPEYTGASAPLEKTGNPELDDAWRYKFLSTAPPHWIPFAPEVRDHNVTGRLVRGRLGEWDLLGEVKEEFAGPKGQIMDPSAPMSVEEEELMRGGIDVARRYESARTPGGRLLIWSSRTKRPSSGDRSSKRETDVIDTRGRK